MAVPAYAAKYEPVDWHKSKAVMSTTAVRQREASDAMRQMSTALRNTTRNKTDWTQHDSNSTMNKRSGDISKWQKALEYCMSKVEAEIAALTDRKGVTEEELQAKQVPLEVVIECLTLRESRISIDQVRDNVELQLHKELEVVEGVRAVLEQKVNEAYDQLSALQDARQQLHFDITDKTAAHQIDQSCSQLENMSEGIAYHHNPTRVEKGIVTPATWDSYSNYNTMRGQAEMKSSLSLREAIDHTIAQTRTDLDAQHRATNLAFRRRIHEMSQAKDELEWQRKTTIDELAVVDEEIESLMKALQDKQPPMMVAQTRLEMRTQRPRVELCRDPAQFGLTQEVDELTGTMRALAKQLEAAQQTRDQLQRTLQRVEEDLAIKTNSLDIDRRCMETRQRLEGGGASIAGQTSTAPDSNRSLKASDSMVTSSQVTQTSDGSELSQSSSITSSQTTIDG